jgi:hypothetical protein
MSTTLDEVSVLPKDMVLEIFCRLDNSSLGCCSQVCKDWNDVLNQNVCIWERISTEVFGRVPVLPKGKLLKNFCKKFASQQIKGSNGNSELLDRIQCFLRKIELGQNARFKSVFFLEKSPAPVYLNIKIKGSKDQTSPIPKSSIDFKENLFFRGVGDEHHILASELAAPQFYEQHVFSTDKVENQDKIITSYTFPVSGPFQGSIEFPRDILANKDQRLDMRFSIENLVRIKLDNLVTQNQRQNPINSGIEAPPLLFGYRVKHSN